MNKKLKTGKRGPGRPKLPDTPERREARRLRHNARMRRYWTTHPKAYAKLKKKAAAMGRKARAEGRKPTPTMAQLTPAEVAARREYNRLYARQRRAKAKFPLDESSKTTDNPFAQTTSGPPRNRRCGAKHKMKTEIPHWEKPLAAAGLTSYRYPAGMGLLSSHQTWVMIGAKDHADAISEANRSLSQKTASMDKLQIWDGEKYVSVLTTPTQPLASASLNARERKAQRLLAHYATCERLARYVANLSTVKHVTQKDGQKAVIFGSNIGDHFRFDGKKISVALFKAERLGQQRAERMCSDSNYTESQQNDDKNRVISMVANALGNISLPPGSFVNSDPRGYALLIDNETPEGKALIEAVGLQRDAGGFGILSPEINGDR